MPGVLPSDSHGLSRDTPAAKSRLSLKFFQKRETKRALDFVESAENEQKASAYESSEIDQIVPAAQPLSPACCDKKDNMLPFVGLNNLGNTCYLNSILQVLYFCPGFKTGVKQLFNIISKGKESLKDEIDKETTKEHSFGSYELVCSLHTLIVSVEQLQASFLLNPDKYTDELATQPRRLLNTLRELNPILGKLKTNLVSKDQVKDINNCELTDSSLKYENESKSNRECCDSSSMKITVGERTECFSQEFAIFNLVERLFQGQLVLRTRCLECECFTERREDFQDISVPVQKDELLKVEENSEISPEPKTDVKTLKWAISQFASIERIVGEDKYFCENCLHYTEAERSLLFDKMPEVVTIHLKCFAASGLEFDSYGGLSKINTPLQTPLKLSLDDWSINPANEIYGLFAIVMHSGITISSGHYTASVKLTDLDSLQIDSDNFSSDVLCKFCPEPLNEQEAKAVTEDYDDANYGYYNDIGITG
ncbi:ubiquitin carboxyl-terminal hydrolase 1 [Crotalus adamanteus]|uniref:Ubiquitin carboxyl-terminal hydrolase n=1 Tax=Crotalus adamanteus TaxID=8729 RepID=A0AAW1BRX9_CROAD